MMQALKEYANIVKGLALEYSKKDLTIEKIRQEHKELNFMDDDELTKLIINTNNER